MTKSFALVTAIIAALVAGVFTLAVVTHHQNSVPSPTPISAARHPSGGQAQAAGQGKHTVSITFDYDFRLTPACTARVTKHCVRQFVAYDISDGVAANQCAKLFSIAIPSHQNGPVKGIAGTSPLLDFKSGKHLIAVMAVEPDGTESAPTACTTWIVIP